MAKFLSALQICALPKAELRERGLSVPWFQVLEAFIYESDRFGLIVTPRGFLTDFGSVPRAARWYVNDDDPDLLYPSLPHDFLYDRRGVLADGRKFSRAQCDDVLAEAMRSLGARSDHVAVIHAAVRIGGWAHWKEGKP